MKGPPKDHLPASEPHPPKGQIAHSSLACVEHPLNVESAVHGGGLDVPVLGTDVLGFAIS